jgi:cytochrome P450
MNIVSAEFKADPFPVLARSRSEEPIRRTTLPDKTKTPVWPVTRYEDVNALLKDERLRRRPSMILRGIDSLPVLF